MVSEGQELERNKGTRPGCSWSPRGQVAPLGRWDSREGAPGWGRHMARPEPLVEEELKEIWDLECISQPGYRSWDCEMGVCPQTTVGTRLSGPPDSTCGCLPLAGVGSPTGGSLDRNVKVQPRKEALRLPVPAVWAALLAGFTGVQPRQMPRPQAPKGPLLGLRFYCHHLEVLHN